MSNQSVHSSTIPTDVGDLRSLPLLLPIEVARHIPQVSGRYLRKLCEDGTIRAVKCGRTWRVNRDSLLRFCGLSD